MATRTNPGQPGTPNDSFCTPGNSFSSDTNDTSTRSRQEVPHNVKPIATIDLLTSDDDADDNAGNTKGLEANAVNACNAVNATRDAGANVDTVDGAHQDCAHDEEHDEEHDDDNTAGHVCDNVGHADGQEADKEEDDADYDDNDDAPGAHEAHEEPEQPEEPALRRSKRPRKQMTEVPREDDPVWNAFVQYLREDSVTCDTSLSG